MSDHSKSSDASHHVGPVPSITEADLQHALDVQIRRSSAQEAFEFGNYAHVKRSQAIKAAGLVSNFAFLAAILPLIPGLRLRSTMLRKCLAAVDGKYTCNCSSRSREDWARATAITMAILFAHARRLRNARLFQQATRRLKAEPKRQLQELRDLVLKYCPLVAKAGITKLHSFKNNILSFKKICYAQICKSQILDPRYLKTFYINT